MYDLQDEIRQVTEEIKKALDEQTDTLLAATNEVVDEVQKNRDAILASKAEVLNFIAEKNEEMLNEMRGMKDYLTDVFQVSPRSLETWYNIQRRYFGIGASSPSGSICGRGRLFNPFSNVLGPILAKLGRVRAFIIRDSRLPWRYCHN